MKFKQTLLTHFRLVLITITTSPIISDSQAFGGTMGTYNRATISPRKLFSETQETIPVTEDTPTPLENKSGANPPSRPKLVDISFDTYQTQGSQAIPVRTDEIPLLDANNRQKRKKEGHYNATKP